MTDEQRNRLLTEAAVYAKYGLRRKQLRHLERIHALFHDHDDTVAAFAAYDEAVAASHASVAAWLNRSDGLRDALGVDGPRRLGRVLAGHRAERIELVDRATVRFVEVHGNGRMVWLLNPTGVREAFDPDVVPARANLSIFVDAFAVAVEQADPGLGPLQEILEAFQRITPLVVLQDERELDVGEEPPHQSGDTVRFVAGWRPASTAGQEPSLRLQRPHIAIVIDTATPRLLR